MAQLASSLSWPHQSPRLSTRTIWVLGLIALAHLALFVAMNSMPMPSVAVPPMLTMVKILLPVAAPPKTLLTPPKPPRVLTTLPVKPPPVLVPPSPQASPGLLSETTQPLAAPVAGPAPLSQLAPLPAALRETPAPALSGPQFDADYLDNPAPAYPPLSRRTHEEGKVVLRVYVEASGQPSRLEVSISSGFERLDKAALAAVSRWRFVPARKGTEEVSAWVLVPIVFSLNS
jgi:protein TonB